MSGYSTCPVGLSAMATKQYLMGLLSMTNSKGQRLTDLLTYVNGIDTTVEEKFKGSGRGRGIDVDALAAEIAAKITEDEAARAENPKHRGMKPHPEKGVDINDIKAKIVKYMERRRRSGGNASQILSSGVTTKGTDFTKKNEDNKLNSFIKSKYLQELFVDADILNVEASLPVNVMEEFFEAEIAEKATPDTWNMQKDYDTFIVTVAEKNPDGTPAMETYVDLEAGGIKKERQKTSIRVVSYDPHRGSNSHSVGSCTVVEDQVVAGAFIQAGKEMAAKNLKTGQKVADQVNGMSWGVAAKAMGGTSTMTVKDSKGAEKESGGQINIFNIHGKMDLDKEAANSMLKKPNKDVRRKRKLF